MKLTIGEHAGFCFGVRRAVKTAFDAAQVPDGTDPQDVPLSLPPDPFVAEPKWERPKTTRRYLQGPFSERLLTYWREGKIACGEIRPTA